MLPDVRTPARVMGLYDAPMWESIERRRMMLQRCRTTGTYFYPPGPGSPDCLEGGWEWTEISGRGIILSWAIFHRQYLPAYPVPYNVVAVRLEEGPVIISNLEGDVPAGAWIGYEVLMTYVKMPDGITLPRFKLLRHPGG